MHPLIVEALTKAAIRFREYATYHAAKPDLEKAQRNTDMAELCERALAQAGVDRGADPVTNGVSTAGGLGTEIVPLSRIIEILTSILQNIKDGEEVDFSIAIAATQLTVLFNSYFKPEEAFEPTEAELDVMAQAADDEESAQKGEPSLWTIYARGEFSGTAEDWAEYKSERRAAMACALRALAAL